MLMEYADWPDALKAVALNRLIAQIRLDYDRSEGRIVIVAGGTGNPYFTTDTTAALRACELDVDVLMKATKVDGVYDSDPRVNPEAKLLRDITYQEVQERDLKVMDASAITICRENKVPCIRVFGLDDPQNILRVIEGDMMGTVVHP